MKGNYGASTAKKNTTTHVRNILFIKYIYIFVKDGKYGNGAYVCEKCAYIPSDVKDKFNRQVKTRRDAEIKKLKHDLILLEKELAAERDHVFKLETEQPKNSKKGRLGSVGEDMNEAVIEDSSNKDIEIQTLMNENELLKSTTCEINNSKIKCTTVTAAITEEATVQTMDMDKTSEIKER